MLGYSFYTFDEVRNLTFLAFFRTFWPWMTSNDLETKFFRQFTSRASFWGMTWMLSVMSEISSLSTPKWVIFRFFGSHGRARLSAREILCLPSLNFILNQKNSISRLGEPGEKNYFTKVDFDDFYDVISRNPEKFFAISWKIIFFLGS